MSDIPNATPHRVPIAVIIPTRNRPRVLLRTLESIAAQDLQPEEVVVIDGSDEGARIGAEEVRHCGLSFPVSLRRADVISAAGQRNQGVRLTVQPIVGFFDDDIILRSGCFRELFRAIDGDPTVGAVGASIENQSYRPPKRSLKWLLDRLADRPGPSYEGRVIGPALNFLPEFRPGNDASQVDWLSTTCSLYRRAAMPLPPFSEFFTGYSLMEDLALSLEIGKRWRLLYVHAARIYHDSQPATHKNDPNIRNRMEVVNRHYVMTRILKKNRLSDYIKLVVWEFAQSGFLFLQTADLRATIFDIWGRVLGFAAVVRRRERGRAT